MGYKKEQNVNGTMLDGNCNDSSLTHVCIKQVSMAAGVVGTCIRECLVSAYSHLSWAFAAGQMVGY